MAIVTKFVQKGVTMHDTPAKNKNKLCTINARMFGIKAIALDSNRPTIVLAPSTKRSTQR